MMALETKELTAVFPHSIDAEQSVLGSILMDRNALNLTAEIIDSSDFYTEQHKAIYSAFQALSEVNEPIDTVTVGEMLRKRGQLELTGGFPYLVLLLDAVPSSANVENYAKTVRKKSRLRSSMELARQVLASANDSDADDDQKLEAIEGLALGVRESMPKRYQKYGDGLSAAYERANERASSGTKSIGIPTGYPEVDKILYGMAPNQLIIVAARPGMGKSAFALNLALNMAIFEGKRVGFWTLEMSKEEVFDRAAVLETNIFPMRLALGQMSDEQWIRFDKVVRDREKTPIAISDTRYLTPQKLRSEALRMRSEMGLDIIIVDYVQLMEWPGRSENETVRLSNISRYLKNLAGELNIPILALSQLSRDVEKREDKRPVMSDLRGSGAWEQDADKIIFLYRETYYHKDKITQGIPESTDINIVKHRGGPTGSAKLEWQGCYMQFNNENEMGEMQGPTGF